MTTVNQNHPSWEQLSSEAQKPYIRKAKYLISRQYCNLDVYKLAEIIYNKQYGNNQNN